jgi:hypothetical protein
VSYPAQPGSWLHKPELALLPAKHTVMTPNCYFKLCVWVVLFNHGRDVGRLMAVAGHADQGDVFAGGEDFGEGHELPMPS